MLLWLKMNAGSWIVTISLAFIFNQNEIWFEPLLKFVHAVKLAYATNKPRLYSDELNF